MMTLSQFRNYICIIGFYCLSSISLFAQMDAPSQIDLGAFIQLAFEESNEIKIGETNLKITQLKRGAALGNYLPNVYASWKVGKETRIISGLDNDDTDENTKSITIEQPIFNGFQSAYGTQSAESSVVAATADLMSIKSTVYLTAVETYLNLFQSRQLFSYYKENVQLSDAILSLISQRKGLQMIAQDESLQYESDALRLKSEALNAQRELFKSEIDYDYLVNVVHDELDAPQIPSTTFNIESEYDQAVESNHNLKKMFYLTKSYRTDLAAVRGELLPKVNLVGTYQRQDNVLYLNNNNLDTKSYYVDVSFSLFAKGQRFVSISTAIEKYEFSVKEYELAKHQLYKDIRQAIKSYDSSSQLVQSFLELKVLAENKIKKLSEQVALGAVDKLIYLTAQQELNLIKIQYLMVRTEMILSYYNVLSLTGMAHLDYDK